MSIGPQTQAKVSFATLGFIVAIVFAAAGIYFKIPSAEQIRALDEKHSMAERELAATIARNTGRVQHLNGKLSMLVELERTKADRDPETRELFYDTARRVEHAQGVDPLEGKMEQ